MFRRPSAPATTTGFPFNEPSSDNHSAHPPVRNWDRNLTWRSGPRPKTTSRPSKFLAKVGLPSCSPPRVPHSDQLPLGTSCQRFRKEPSWARRTISNRPSALRATAAVELAKSPPSEAHDDQSPFGATCQL